MKKSLLGIVVLFVVSVLLVSLASSRQSICSASGWLHLVKASSAVYCPAGGPIVWSVTYDASRSHVIVANFDKNIWWTFPLKANSVYDDSFRVNLSKTAWVLETGPRQGDWMLVTLKGR